MDQSSGTTQHADEDPFLEEIRAIKQEISEQYGNDVRRLGRQLQIEQEVHGSRLVRNPRNKAKAS